MNTTLRHKLLAYLAGAALVVPSASATAGQSDLSMIPEPIMVELLGEMDNEAWSSDDIRSLLELLAEDPRKQVRRSTVELLDHIRNGRAWSDFEPVLEKLARDESPEVKGALATTVANWLSLADHFTASRVVLEWASSEMKAMRRIMARALGLGFQALGADLALECLARDRDPAVRRDTIRTIANRFVENPDLYARILSGLATDSSRSVRKTARRTLKQLKPLVPARTSRPGQSG